MNRERYQWNSLVLSVKYNPTMHACTYTKCTIHKTSIISLDLQGLCDQPKPERLVPLNGILHHNRLDWWQTTAPKLIFNAIFLLHFLSSIFLLGLNRLSYTCMHANFWNVGYWNFIIFVGVANIRLIEYGDPVLQHTCSLTSETWIPERSVYWINDISYTKVTSRPLRMLLCSQCFV